MNKNKSFLGSIFSLVSFSNRLIALNVIVYFLFFFIGFFTKNFDRLIFLYPEDIIQGKNLWTLLTSVFMHGSIFHLFVNMITLFFLGNFSEQIMGRKKFITLYLLAGLVGGLFYVLGSFIGSHITSLANVLGTLDVPAVGASGALFGLLGLLAVIVPRFKVYLIAGPIIVIIISFIAESFLPAGIGSFVSLLASILTFVMIFFMFSSNPKRRKYAVPVGMDMWLAPIVAIVPLVVISFFVPLPIGNTAHFGGLVVGLIYGIVLRLKYPKKIQLLQRILRGGA
ncbi:MAG: rhomboid family intramembrane serine protease [Nanoarchaeota archaeon]